MLNELCGAYNEWPPVRARWRKPIRVLSTEDGQRCHGLASQWLDQGTRTREIPPKFAAPCYFRRFDKTTPSNWAVVRPCNPKCSVPLEDPQVPFSLEGSHRPRDLYLLHHAHRVTWSYEGSALESWLETLEQLQERLMAGIILRGHSVLGIPMHLYSVVAHQNFIRYAPGILSLFTCNHRWII